MKKKTFRKMIAMLLLLMFAVSSLTPMDTLATDADVIDESLETEAAQDILGDSGLAEETREEGQEKAGQEEEIDRIEKVAADAPVMTVAADGEADITEVLNESDELEQVLAFQEDTILDEPIVIDQDNAVYHFSAEEVVNLYQAQDAKPHIIIDGAKNVSLSFENIRLNGEERTGGIEVRNGAQATLSNVNIENSKSITGGGLYVAGAGSTLKVNGGTIINNTAESGGGLYATDGAAVVLDNGVQIIGNRAECGSKNQYMYGGGLYLGADVKAAISNTTFSANSAYAEKGDSRKLGHGGAIAIVGAQEITFGSNVKIGSDRQADSNKAVVGAGIYYTNNKGTDLEHALELGSGVSITNNETYYQNASGVSASSSYSFGGGLYIDKNCAAVIDGAKINDNYALYYAGGIAVQDGSMLYMKDGQVNNNKAVNSGAGIKVEKNGTFIIDKGTVNYNVSSANGAGIHGAFSNLYKSKVILNGGEISHNEILRGTSRNMGAGIYAYYLEINGAKIDYNMVHKGAAAAVRAYTVVLNDGSISNNYSGEMNHYYEGVSLGTTVTAEEFYMNGGEISNNSFGTKDASREFYVGGTVYVGDDEDEQVVEITGGTFSNNKAEFGGALYLAYVEAEITGDVKFNNNEALKGGAVYADDLNDLTIGADVTFENNYAEGAYLMSDADDITLHEDKVAAVQFSLGLPYGYNNYDINYTGGELLNEKTVTFHLNYLESEEDNIYDIQKLFYGKAEQPEEPEREGYDFTGWYTDREMAECYAFEAMVTNSFTLYAGWEEEYVEPEPEIYEVTFDANGGAFAETAITVIEIEEGNVLTEGQAPGVMRAGYEFTGWYIDEAAENAYDFETMVTNSFTLYAGWEEEYAEPDPEPEVYQVTFDTNGLTDTEVGEYGSQFVNGNTTINLEAEEGQLIAIPFERPKQFGYIFAGWYTKGAQEEKSDAAGTYYRYSGDWGREWDFAEPVEADITLYAKWVEDTFYVETLNQLTAALSSMRDEINVQLRNNIVLEDKIKALRFKKTTVVNISSSDEDETKYITQTGEAYHFALFSQGVDFTLAFNHVILDSESGYGGIELDGHSTFRLKGNGTSTITGVTERAYGGAIDADQKATVFVEGMILEGNSVKADETTNAGRGGAIYAGGETHLSVKDTIIRDNHATYGGGIYVVEALSYLEMDNVTFEENSADLKGGGLFINGAEIVNAVDEEGLGDIKFFQNEASYYVNVLSEESKQAFLEFAPKSQTYTTYKEEVVFELAYNNYDINYGGEVYTVTYDANKGNGEGPVDNNYYGEFSTVRVEGDGTLERDEYTFEGWHVEADVEEPLYTAGETFTIEADTVLYAVWAAETDNGGGDPGIPEEPEEPKEPEEPEEPKKPGKETPGDKEKDTEKGSGNIGGNVTKKITSIVKSNVPKTGDFGYAIYLWSILGLGAVLAAAIVVKKKKSDK